MYIAIAGNIGSGKTTLTKMLSKHYGWKQYLEPVAENPYIDDYYKDISRWALNMEVFYLKQRFKNLLEIQHSKETVIQDRTIFEGVYVFAANNRKMGNMDQRDYETYMELFESMMEVVEMPELMIYLRSSVPHLVKNIQKRGRDFEKSIRIDYLQGLNKRYEDWIKDYKGRLIIIDGDNLEFGENPEDFRKVTDLIDAELFGLFAEKGV
ncbi:deoxynucleoside kinase [Segatella sp.]|uniref:deoxynucleoside kinase n=2 Tax=Segatella sp. TaxID=2974253 RepID=UPI003078FFB3